MRYICLLLLLLPVLLPAEMLPPIPLPGENSGGAAPLHTTQDLLTQAYANMLNGNYALAETQYTSLTELDPTNPAGWEGLLWAQNSLGKYSATLMLSHQRLQSNPTQVALHNYRAYALLMLSRYPEARQHYQKGLNGQPGNPLANQLSNEGIAYSYLGMSDYPRYHKFINAASTISGIPAPKAKPRFSTTLSYKLPGEGKTAFAAAQSIAYRNYSLSAAYEDFRLESEPFRTKLKAELKTQLMPLDVSIIANQLSGEDQRVYPAWQLGTELAPSLYPGSLSFKPAILVSYSHYPRFDVQQASFKPTLGFRDYSLRYAFHAAFIDNETADADSMHYAHQLQVTRKLPYNFSLGLYYGSGNDTWILDSTNGIIDTFNQNGSYFGASLAKSLLKRFTLFAYYQKWQSEQLWYFSLAGNY